MQQNSEQGQLGLYKLDLMVVKLNHGGGGGEVEPLVYSLMSKTV